ncbi:type I methionyl aminopeptidase [Mycoplasmatota bacterium]|nr:type I methionyl aminopeptidase [Mycoplasmatota bacterium]
MITIKSQREINLMKEAGKIVAMCHQEISKIIKPGITTNKIDALVEKIIISNGGTPSFKGYNGFPSSICASINDVVVHGIPSNMKLKNGDIISIDIGVNYKGYHGDSAWTYPVGNISESDEKLLEVTKKSLFEGLKFAKEGNRLSDISHAIEEYVKPFGYGIVEDFTGHGIGSKLHEDPPIPNFGINGRGPILKSGMTLAIEPMVNAGTKRVKIMVDGWTTKTIDGQNSAHYEHTILITKDGCEILTTTLGGYLWQKTT